MLTPTVRSTRKLFGWKSKARDIEAAAFDHALKSVMGILGAEGVEETLDGIGLGCGIEGLLPEGHEPITMTPLEWRWRFLPSAVSAIDDELLDHRCVWTRVSDGDHEVIYRGYQPDHPQAESFFITQVPCPPGVRIRVQEAAPEPQPENPGDDAVESDAAGQPGAPRISIIRSTTRPAPAMASTAKPPKKNHWWECDPTEFRRTVAEGDELTNELWHAVAPLNWGAPLSRTIDLTSDLPSELWIDWLLQRMRPEEHEQIGRLRVELRRAKCVELEVAYHARRGPNEVSCWLVRGGVRTKVGWVRSTDIPSSWKETVEKAVRDHNFYLSWLATNGGVR